MHETPPPTPELPSATSVVHLEDGRLVYLVGTAHVSKKSVDDVKATIEAVGPDAVCVELCEARYRNLRDKEAWRKLDIFQVLRQGKAPLLLSSLVMASVQRRIAADLGVEPGAEMIEGVRQAEALGAELVLADRDIQVTLRRTWARLGLWQRLKLVGQLIGGIFAPLELDEETVNQLAEGEGLEDMMSQLATALPQVKTTLIDERDRYLAQKIRDASGSKIVAIVGAGHVAGIKNQLATDADLEALEQVPVRALWTRLVAWGIPVAILALLVVGFLRGGVEQSAGSLWIWFLVNGLLAALGAAVALGHPVTVLAALVAAPITSLNPFVAAGWVAGLVQAWIRKPTVADFENLPAAITTVKGFWRNPVTRILLVVVLANLGSSLGTFVAGGWIAARVL